nr:ATP-dependent DNA helicase [Ipomoea batatas]
MASFGSVKLEIEDPLEDQHAPLSKRSRLSGSSSLPSDQWSNGSNEFQIPPTQYNPLDEPSPLGLRLRKSPSLLDLIQMKLSQSNASPMLPTSSDQTSGSKKEERGSSTSSGTDKLKASNFCGSLLKIGSWEYVSRYEGDLVAKCYFAKHKIVWEILEGGLKSKIEIQWSDIMGLRADCPDDDPGTLTIVLVRQPLFFRETNPQPRKHTLWQATTDFTDGQASINRQHILRCPPGVLNKHFEKLIMCDTRLHFLSQQPEILMNSPYFESQPSPVENSNELKDHGLNLLSAAKGSPTTGVQSIASSPAAGQSSISFEQDLLNGAPEHSSKDASSPSSVMDTRAIEGNGRNLKGNDSVRRECWEQLKVTGLRPSMSMTDLVNHIGNCISEQVNSGNMHSNQASECQGILENIAHILMSDNQSAAAAASDEKCLMKKVNSLCCLLQDPATINNAQLDEEKHLGVAVSHDEEAKTGSGSGSVICGEDSRQAAPSIPRRDSFADLLFQLPRIASLPKFLFDIAEDDGNQP